MKAVVEWHAVYDHCLEIADALKDEVSYPFIILRFVT